MTGRSPNGPGPEPRLKASIVVPYEDAAASVAGDRALGRAIPTWCRCCCCPAPSSRWATGAIGRSTKRPRGPGCRSASMPSAMAASPPAAAGGASFYIEDMVGHSQSCQAVVSSMVTEGVVRTHLPTLRIVMIEAGFAWLPSLAWRMDRVWHPHQGGKSGFDPAAQRIHPRSYLADDTAHGRARSTPEHLRDTLEWIGMDRLLFATDYPHWDYDDPQQSLKIRLAPAEREAFFIGNARALYRPRGAG